MSFESPSLVRRVLARIDESDTSRSVNRGLIDRLFNGEPPYTQNEAAENNIEWNFNTKQATKLAHDARGRFNGAHLTTKNYFTVSLNHGPVHKRDTYAAIITECINKVMKKSLAYATTLRETFATVVLHGSGPVMWPDKYSWRPRTVGIFDLKIPSKTYVSFDNLWYFGIYREFTPAELFSLTHKDKVDPGWNKEAVDACINYCVEHTDGYQTAGQDYGTLWGTNPEKYWEEFRANVGWWQSDAVQKVAVYDFFYREVYSKNEEWKRCMLLVRPLQGVSKPKDGKEVGDCGDVFLYNPKRVYADDLRKILHCQFADYNNVAPFLFHSVRGLGFLLYDLAHALNRLQCKMTESAFEQLMMLFRANDPSDRDRLDKLDLRHLGIIPEGLQIVPNTERYSPNQQIVQGALAQNQNSLNQNSSSFTNDAAMQQGKEQTLGEWSGKLSLYNQMVGATLQLSYEYQKHQYIEICRRFCLDHSTDPDVVEFQQMCKRKGLPAVYLNSDHWDISPDRVLGGGNQALAIQEASALFQNRFAYSPKGQQVVAHRFALAVSNDAELASALVPLDGMMPASQGQKHAEQIFGTLMAGVLPQSASEEPDHIPFIETLQGMLNAKVEQFNQMGGEAPMESVIGMDTVSKATWQHIEMLAQDRSQKALVKQYSDVQGNLDNQIKAFGQRAQEAMQTQGEDGKMQAELIKAQTQSKIKEAQAGQKMQHKDQAFEADQRRKDLTLAQQLNQTALTAEQQRALDDADTAAEIQRQRAKNTVTVTTTE